ncbi:MAG: DUF924 family protein, partial [Spirochaetota bacterium]
MYQEILDFWFRELEPEMWWEKSPDLDGRIRQRFAAVHERALR